MQRSLLFLVFTFSIVLSIQGLMYKIPREELCERSDAIIVGNVVSQESRWDEQYKKIYTYISIEVQEQWKGRKKERLVIVRVPGGEVGEIGMRVSDLSAFQTEETDVLFLRKTGEKGLYLLTGKNQGRYIVSSDSETDEKIVRRPQFSYVDQNGTKLGEIKTTAVTPSVATVFYSDFKHDIFEILKKNQENVHE